MKIIAIFIFINLFGLCVAGQEAQENQLNFLIAKEYKQTCFGDSLNIIGKLTNISNNPIVIDTKQIGYSANYSWFTKTSKGDAVGSFNLISDVGPGYQPTFVILKPSESYSKKITLVLDKELFAQSRKYELQIGYGQFFRTQFQNIDVWNGVIKSNEIEITIKKCKL